MSEMKQKLAVILDADVAGFSRLMNIDERSTIATLDEYRYILQQEIEANGGRVVDMAGDSVLAVFDSAIGAVRAAVAAQNELARRNERLPENRRMEFRIGLNSGDIYEKDDGSIYGDGVNVAARLQTMADPGGISVSGSVFDVVRAKLDVPFAFLGEHEVKNIPQPVRAYRVQSKNTSLFAALASRLRQPGRAGVIAGTATVFLVVVSFVTWQVTRTSEESEGTGWFKRGDSDRLLAMPKGPSIAVLPFSNLSGDPAQDFFAEGLAAEVSAELSRSSDLAVIGHSATTAHKEAKADIKQVARELRVQFILKGGVRKAGDQVRLTAELIQGADGRQVWTNSYDRRLDPQSLIAVQQEIAQSVVATVADQYGVIPRLARKGWRSAPPENLSSYECVLLFYEYFQVYTPELHRRVRDCLEQTVARDPIYADAWGRLALVYAHEHSMGLNPQPRALERALEAAQTGVRADPNSQVSYEGLAATYYFTRDRERFIKAAERTVALNPNNVSVIANIGFYYATWGMYDRGLPLLKKAIDLSPYRNWWYWIAFWQEAYERGDYEAALDYAEKANYPGLYYSQMRLVPTYAQLELMEQASQELRTLLELKPDFPERMREEWRFWNTPEPVIDKLAEGYRKAGMVLPHESGR